MSDMAASVGAVKKSIRTSMKATLRALSQEYVAGASAECCRRVKMTEQYRNSKSICCYLSMISEVQTYSFIQEAFAEGKQIYIPKVIGPKSEDMIVIPLESFEAISSFPMSNWGIPEPSDQYISRVRDVSGAAVLDLIIVPGVAFDRTGGRLGHGKGYYDCFISKNQTACSELNKPFPITIGVCFDEQLIECIPMDKTDKKLSAIISPSFEYQLAI